MAEPTLHEPWASFLMELDAELSAVTEVHCLGGFVVAELFELPRPTADVDILHTTKGTDAGTLARLAGRGSPLHKKYKVYLDVVTVATVPENYEDRLIPFLPGQFQNLKLKALEPHDLLLAKLERNGDQDLEDLKRLVSAGAIDADVLKARYQAELRPYLGRPEREDLTLELWLEILAELQPPSS